MEQIPLHPIYHSAKQVHNKPVADNIYNLNRSSCQHF